MTSLEVEKERPVVPQAWDISTETLERAAKAHFGAGVKVSAPYWVDADCVRVGILLPDGDVSFGANFHFKEGVFR